MRRTPEAGFTLLEALVALLLGAVVAGAVLVAVQTGGRALARAEHSLSEAEAFSRAGTLLAGDAGHARRMAVDAQGHVFVGRGDRMTFAALPRPDPAAAGGLAEQRPVLVHFRLVTMADGGRQLLRLETAVGVWDTAARAAARGGLPIWAAPGAVDFAFLDARGDWLRDWSGQDGMPRAFGLQGPGDVRPRLVAEFPDALLEPTCAAGPNARLPAAVPPCSLPEGAFR